MKIFFKVKIKLLKKLLSINFYLVNEKIKIKGIASMLECPVYKIKFKFP